MRIYDPIEIKYTKVVLYYIKNVIEINVLH